jgi:hypothetical protein
MTTHNNSLTSPSSDDADTKNDFDIPGAGNKRLVPREFTLGDLVSTCAIEPHEFGTNAAVEDLSLDDEIVASAFWSKKTPIDADGEEIMWSIIGHWRAGDIDAETALRWLEEQALLDPDMTMLGFAAACFATQPPPSDLPPVPPAPAIALEVPEEWPYSNMETLDVLARVRVA